MTFGLQVDEPGSRAILDHAHELGVTFLDTADAYPLGGDLTTVGRTEEILGRWLQGSATSSSSRRSASRRRDRTRGTRD
jgi:aryl-alcohol dehydrogenase (NADP+)